ncbi:MAG: type IV secretory system conjugative DNA transfer family protein [Rhizobiaceae bacterium]|nr:type IV secretory system conjugative DNA transfer family protein [Rhizobiaceae bacterium]
MSQDTGLEGPKTLQKNRPAEFSTPGVHFCLGFIGTIVLISFFHAGGAFSGFITPYRNYIPDYTAFKIVVLTISGLGAFALGWVFSPGGKAFRMGAFGAIAALTVFFIVADHGAIGWTATTVGVWFAVFAGFGYWLREAAQKFFEVPPIFGDARIADENELEANNVYGSDALRLGYHRLRGEVAPIHYDGDRHALLIAPNRSGKGTTAIVPNLFSHTGSAVVVDPKGENALMTAAHRKSMGQEVFVLDPENITDMANASFNPMDTLDPGDADIADKAMILAEALVIVTEGEGRFWDEEAKSLLVGVILYVATEKAEQKQRHLPRVRDLLTLDAGELRKLFEKMSRSAHKVVRSVGAMSLQKDEKTLANVMASAQSHTHFLESPAISNSLSSSTFDFRDLKTKPMTVYVVLSSDKLRSHGRWIRLVLQCALSVNARDITVQPEKPVQFILDELPALGSLPMVEQAFGLMAGYGIQLWAIAQDASQLKRIYGDGWQTFVSNAGVIQYFGSKDKFTAEYFASLCGVTTVWNFTDAVNRSVSSGSPNGSTSSGSSYSMTPTKRPLFNADQLMRLKPNEQLILMGSMNPIIAGRTAWFEDDAFKDLGVNLQAKNKISEA